MSNRSCLPWSNLERLDDVKQTLSAMVKPGEGGIMSNGSVCHGQTWRGWIMSKDLVRHGQTWRGWIMSKDPVPDDTTCPATIRAVGDRKWSGLPLVQALTRKFMEVSKVIF